MRSNNVSKIVLSVFGAAVSILALLVLSRYPGQGYVYVLFTVVANLLLYFGFRKNAIFFDTFIGIFFWLGFWVKLTIRVAFFGGLFSEPVGNFSGSGDAFDRALLVSSCGMSGLLVASFLREKLSCNYPLKTEGIALQGLFGVYRNHRKIVLAGFVVLFFIIAATNAYFGIYQRGSITRTTLPFGLNGVYKWLLLFGLASFAALILRFEFEINRKTSFLAMFISLLESFVTNLSLLSRGMILNAGSLIYGVFTSRKIHSIKSSRQFFAVTLLVLALLSAGSLFLSNYLRLYNEVKSSSQLSGKQDMPLQMAGTQKTVTPSPEKESVTTHLSAIQSATAQPMALHRLIDQTLTVNGVPLLSSIINMTLKLFVDRWVGMEGVMAVSSYPGLGWDLWKRAWKETYNENETSFYDNTFITSPYIIVDKMKFHFISLPGVVAFFFYTGSFLFLFSGMFVLGVIAAIIEYFVFRLGGKNVILCSLLAQVVAFRYLSFGYVPMQSYLLFGTIFLNLFIIYFADKASMLLCNKDS